MYSQLYGQNQAGMSSNRIDFNTAYSPIFNKLNEYRENNV